MKKSTFGPTKVLQKHGLRSAGTWTFITANVRIRALMRERRIVPTLTTCRKPRQQHEFRRRCRGVTPVGLRSFCVTPRQRHTIPQHGRGSTYRPRNAVQTKPATSPPIVGWMPCFVANWAVASSPRSASSATFALNSAEYRFRLLVIQVRPSQEQTELKPLSEFAVPPHFPCSFGLAILQAG